MGYHSITKIHKTLKLNLLCGKTSEMQRKMGQFALYSVVLTTAVTQVDD